MADQQLRRATDFSGTLNRRGLDVGEVADSGSRKATF
jgi:hypothetical protein